MNAPVAPSAIVARLGEIVGERHVMTAQDDMAPYLVEDRGLYHGAALAIVRPGSVDEISRVMALCNAHGIAVVPQGGNTGLVGGQIPVVGSHGIVLSLRRLDRIRAVDTRGNILIAEAGVTLHNVQQAADSAGRLFPLSLASEGSCTIGGNLATNAGGTAVLAYGNTRALVLGIEAVLADGRVLSTLSRLHKDNTGYDLKHLLMGSEGTLAIITAAVLKLFPKPRAFATGFVGVASPAHAFDLLMLAQATAGAGIKTFELMPRIGLDFVLRHAPGTRDPLATLHDWYVLIELTSEIEQPLDDVLMQIMEAASERGMIEDAAIATSLDQRRAFWHLREIMSEVQKHEGGSIKHDVSVPVADVPAFIAEASAAMLAFMPAARMVPFGHLGDGNIHCNVSQPIGADKAEFLAQWKKVNSIVHAVVAHYHGSISAEHGVGQLKVGELPQVKDAVAMEMMRAIKNALDPKGILNPGKVLGKP